MEYDNIYDKEVLDLINTIDEEMLLVNPINDGESFNITQLPKVGVLARLKLKLNVPNGKTRVVIEGISRVEIFDYEKSDILYVASYKIPKQTTSEKEKDYYNVLIKFIDRYIDKVPNMGNAIMSQIDKTYSLGELCDLVITYINLDFNRKKKYIETIDPIKRSELLI